MKFLLKYIFHDKDKFAWISNGMKKTFSIIIILLCLAPVFVSAQASFNNIAPISDELNLAIDPVYPRPFELVNLTLTLYTADLNNSEITWYKDGKVVLAGKGRVNYSFNLGGPGSSAKIEVFVMVPGGEIGSKSLVIAPASVDLVWEANTYVPPFFRGKALHSKQGTLKVVAVPQFILNGRTVNASNLIYTWSNGQNTYPDQSGYGRNTLILDSSELGRDETVQVLVSDPVSNASAKGFVTISPVDPQIVFYENNPYYGTIFNKAMDSGFKLTGTEVEVLSAPFFFSREDATRLQYNWVLNGKAVPSLQSSRTAVFKKPESGSGLSRLSLGIENTSRILQQATANLSLSFEN